MSSETKRYIVTQDPKVKDASVTKSRSFTQPDSSLSANDGVERYKFSEESRLPSAQLESREGSDVTLITGGQVDPQYSTRSQTGSLLQRDPAPVDIHGTGKIQTSGSAGTSRYSFIKSGQSDYQLRATYNQFNKDAHGLERAINTGMPTDIYCRPDVLPLTNGNLLCAYLDNRAHPWCWNFPSSLIEPEFTIQINTNAGDLPNVQAGDAFSIAGTVNTPPLSGGTVTGTVLRTDVANLTLDLLLDTSSDTINWITAGDTMTIGAYTFSVVPNIVTSNWTNSPSGAGRSSQIVKLRLQTKEDRYWSVQSNTVSAPAYPISLPEIAFLDTQSATGSLSQYVNVTGVSIVQFQDTDEVLVIYCGFKGRADQSTGIGFNPGFMCVDSLDADFDTLEGFGGSGNFAPSNRGNFIINQPDQSSLYDGAIFTDVLGLEDEQCRPLDITAEILPSGRLVVVVIFEDSAWSLVSDDRGVTFSATKIIDLTFGDLNYVLRIGTVDSTLTSDGRIAIILCCTGLGTRGWGESEPSSLSSLAESVLSIFVSADGANWGREKKLGGGLYMPNYGDVDSNPSQTNWPGDHFEKTYFDQNLYCLSASITRTPEDTYLVSAVGYNQGGPGNGMSQQIYQRVLEVDQILAGQDGEAIAPTLPPQIFSESEPYANEYQRLVVAKYQPSVKMDDAIGSGQLPEYTHPTITAYHASNIPGGAPGAVSPGYLGQLYFARLPRSTATGFLTKGGGPFWSQGPIDIGTCLWRDSVVTVTCGIAEFEPVDYPNSGPDYGVTGVQTAEARRETYVEVLYSGGFQPALIRVPNWTRWWVRGFGANGTKATAKLPFVGSNFDTEDLCYQLAGNGYQISYNAPRNPFDQAWETFISGSPTESFVNFTSDNRSIFRGLFNTVAGNSGAAIYYGYAEELSAFYENKVFPNKDGDILKTHADFPSTNYFLGAGLDPLSFVGRMVLSFPFAGGYDSATNSFPKSTILGSKIELHSQGTTRISIDIRIGRDLTTRKVGIHLYDRVGGVTLCSIVFDNFKDLLSFNSNTAPQYEIVFNVKRAETGQYFARLMARRWDRYADPDWLDDYSTSFNDSTPVTTGTVGAQTEHVRFGVFQSGTSAGDTTQVSWISYQFSRTFFRLDSAFIDVYREELPTRPLPRGMDEFITPGLNKLELPLDDLRNVNGGLFSSSSPSKTSIPTQMIDRGIELGFAGRSTDEDEFSYSGKSTMPTEGIFKLPASTGWRSISDTVAFEIAPQNPVSGGSPDVQVDVVPDYELMFDFGEEGILPESLAFFGINTDEIIVDFSDDSTMTMLLTGSGSPSLSSWFSSPGGHATKIWNYLTGTPSASTTEITYKPNYLFYWENYSVIDGSAVVFGNGDLEASLDEDASPYVVRFKSAGWDSATSSISQNQGRYAPFIPSQFKSQPGENYYLVVYTRDLYTDINNSGPALVSDWSLGTDCRFRHVFKIKDNGSDHLVLTSDIASNFTTVRGFVTSEKTKLPIGTMTIISDRVATNLPDFFPDVSKTSATARGQDGLSRYRYMRIRLGGAQFHDSTEDHLQMGMMIAGQRISLGFRDVDWGWSYNLGFGNTLYTGLTGQRRGRKNHKPRREWTISYSPRPSQPIDVKTDAANTYNVNQYQNPMKGHGKIGNALYPNNTEQMSNISKLSWMEAVQRVLTLEVNGDVVALAFDGDNMINNHSLQTDFPQYGSIRPAASDPSSLVPARLIGYGGATNQAYQADHEMGNQPTGESLISQRTQCRARPIVTVSGLKFSEEL